MVTIYDLLEVSEDASKEEIENAYSKLILQYSINPSSNQETNEKNEFIINKLKVAYDILLNDEKRKKYDQMLAQKKAEDLIKNISTQNDETANEEELSIVESDNKFIGEDKNVDDDYDDDYDEDVDVELTSNEQKKIRKAAKEEFRKNLKKAQKVQEEYKKAYEKEYKNYLNGKNNTFLKKAKKILIFLIVLVIVSVIIFNLPPVKNAFIDLYNNNAIIRAIFDVFSSK